MPLENMVTKANPRIVSLEESDTRELDGKSLAKPSSTEQAIRIYGVMREKVCVNVCYHCEKDCFREK